MNVFLNLSPGQLSKLRNGHGIRINPMMAGSGVDIIIDPKTYHNLSKKLERGKGAVFKLGPAEINMNIMEGSGLFAGSGNKSGKINRLKKAEKWRDFAGDTVDRGLDLGKKGLDIYQQATNPIKKIFGFGEMDMEGGNVFGDIKNAYNKNVKNTSAGKAIRDSARSGLNKGYDIGSSALSKNQYTKPLGKLALNSKAKNVDKLMQLSGLGIFDDVKNAYNKNVKNTSAGKAIRDSARTGLNVGYDAGTKLLEGNKYTKPIATIGRNSKDANINRAMKMSGLGMKLSGDGMKLSGGRCCGCGAMQNDKFLFGNQAL